MIRIAGGGANTLHRSLVTVPPVWDRVNSTPTDPATWRGSFFHGPYDQALNIDPVRVGNSRDASTAGRRLGLHKGRHKGRHIGRAVYR